MHRYHHERLLPSRNLAHGGHSRWIVAFVLCSAVAALVGSAVSEPVPASNTTPATVEHTASVTPTAELDNDPSPFRYLVYDWTGPIPGFDRH